MSARLDAVGAALPAALACSACGDNIERGYVPVVAADEPRPEADQAVCDVCGWGEIGYTGCAPELGDFDGADLLVRLEHGDGGLTPASVTDEA